MVNSFSETCPLGSANKAFPVGTIVAESSAKNLGGSGTSWTTANAKAKSIF
jgi:hypothetical protein